MTRKRLHRIGGGILLVAALLSVGLLALHARLPQLIERRATEFFRSQGLREPRLEVRSVGFRRTEFGGLQLAGPSWRMMLDQGRANYRPLEVPRGRITSLQLDGLTLHWNLLTAPPPPSPDAAGLTADWLASLPSRLPLRHFTASNSTLMLHDKGGARILPLTAWLVTEPDLASLQAGLVASNSSNQIRLEGRIESTGETRLSASFNLLEPAAWLRRLTPDSGPLQGTVLLSARLLDENPEFSARLDLRLPHSTRPDGEVSDAALFGTVTWRQPTALSAALPEWLLRWFNLDPAQAPFQLPPNEADLELRAANLHLANMVNLEHPALRVRRGAATLPNSEIALEFEASVASLAGLGITARDLRSLALLDHEKLRLAGTLNWLGASFPFLVDLRPRADPHRCGQLAARFTLGPVHLDRARLPDPSAAGAEITLTGEASLEGQLLLHPDAPAEMSARLEVELAQLDWPARNLSLGELRTTLTIRGSDARLASTTDELMAGRLSWGDQQLTDLRARLEHTADGMIQLELLDALWLGGRVRVKPLRWEPATGDLQLTLWLDALELNELGRQIPGFTGQLSGRLNGRIPIARHRGRWHIEGGRLELDPSVPASLAYPADGVLTSGLQPGSPRYNQLRQVEVGLADLTLLALTADLEGPDPQSPILRLRLEGVSHSAHAVVPVTLNLNVQGDFDQLLRLLESGQLEFTW